MVLRALSIATVVVAFLVAAPAYGEQTNAAKQSRATACLDMPYAYAGLQSDWQANGVKATIVPVRAPAVIDGHVGGWVGVGGFGEGPGGKSQWLQVGFASFTDDELPRLYYEVTVAGKQPRYHELRANVTPGVPTRVAVLEIPGRKSQWRVWVNGRPASNAIFLPKSHGRWYPQAVAENWNGGTGACNGYRFRFANLQVRVDAQNKRTWLPMKKGYVFQDRGYKVMRLSGSAPGFIATSLY